LAWIATAAADAWLGHVRPGWRRAAHAAVVAGCWTVLLSFAAIAIWYATRTTYMDPAEPTIPAVASVFRVGKPLYPALDAPERYAHIYGPDLFIAQAAAMAVLGESIRVSKSVGVLAILGSLLFAYRLFAARAGRFPAALGTAACALIFMCFGNASFWSRPDPLLVVCVIVGLHACETRDRAWALLMLGAAAGVAINLKVSGPIYFIPAYTLVGVRHGWRTVAGAIAVAIAVAIPPFLIVNVSVTHFAQYVALSARNGLMAAKLRQNAEWVLYLVAPLAAAEYAWRRAPDSASGAHLAGAVSTTLAAIAVLAAKPGAGPFHLMPGAPLVAYGIVRAPIHVWDERWLRSLAVAVAATALVIAVQGQAVFLRMVIDRDRNPVAADLVRFADAHRSGKIGVGYSGTSHLSFARPEIVFRTHDYLLDAPAIQEHRLSGLELPESTYRAMADCRMQYWLIPDAGEPFDTPNAYWPKGPATVFSDEFRRSFLVRYRMTGRTAYFTVWECR
jgi:hypothetical protein